MAKEDNEVVQHTHKQTFQGSQHTPEINPPRRLSPPCLDKRCKPIVGKVKFIYFSTLAEQLKNTNERKRLIVTKFSTSLKNEQQQTKKKRNDGGKQV
jgi:hypothetical protein